VSAAVDLGPARVASERFGWEAVDLVELTDGHINDTYLVRTGHGDGYVLQRINLAVFPDPDAISSNIEVVHRHLRGALLPDPVSAPDGAWLLRNGDEVWRASRQVPGAGPCTELTPESAWQAGSLLGRFHVSLADFDPVQLAVTLPGFHDLRSRLNQLVSVVEADPCGRVEGARHEIDQALERSALADVADDLVSKVPLRAAHYDGKLDNFLFRADEAVCLVDLDTLMPGQWFFDLGDLLRTASTTASEDCPDPERVSVDPELYDAVIDGYLESVPESLLTREEGVALHVAGALATWEQALRFLTDWLGGDPYFRITRPGQNLDRARAQLSLLSTMPGSGSIGVPPS
jgi:Ser/Thr protein kinase RdoA (MazF antagonist)